MPLRPLRSSLGQHLLEWIVLIPAAWVAGSTIFWLWTPRFLLLRKIAVRSLLPGALLASFVLGGTIATSPLRIGPVVAQPIVAGPAQTTSTTKDGASGS